MRDRIKERMRQLSLNENQLSRRMGLKGNGSIWSLLSGRTHTFRDMPLLANALETTTEWLLTGDEQRKENSEQDAKYSEIITKLIMDASVGADAAKQINQAAVQTINAFVADDLMRGVNPDIERYKRIARESLNQKKDKP